MSVPEEYFIGCSKRMLPLIYDWSILINMDALDSLEYSFETPLLAGLQLAQHSNIRLTPASAAGSIPLEEMLSSLL